MQSGDLAEATAGTRETRTATRCKDAVAQAEKEAKQIEKIELQDLKSGDPDKKAAAEKKLEDMKQQAGQNAAGQQKPDPKEIENAIKQTQSADPNEQQQGRDKLDQTVGKENRRESGRRTG